MVKGPHAESSLEKLTELWQNRPGRVREFRSQGTKIVGYCCCYLPVEILTAANLVPYRVTGSLRDPVTVANVHCDPGICPYLKSYFDMVDDRTYSDVLVKDMLTAFMETVDEAKRERQAA